MAYTLRQAAKASGKGKSTILRAIQTGKISAARNEATGGWTIDPSELHRVYPSVPRVPSGTDWRVPSGQDATDEPASLRMRAEVAEARLADAREQIDDLRQQRDRLLSLHEADQRLLADCAGSRSLGTDGGTSGAGRRPETPSHPQSRDVPPAGFAGAWKRV
jgi:hypothetical protein